MAVMMLAEQGRLSYDDLVAHHVTELAGAMPGITIRHLLTHTSGIPDVGDLGIDRPRLRETDVVNAIRTHHARFADPSSITATATRGTFSSRWRLSTHLDGRSTHFCGRPFSVPHWT